MRRSAAPSQRHVPLFGLSKPAKSNSEILSLLKAPARAQQDPSVPQKGSESDSLADVTNVDIDKVVFKPPPREESVPITVQKQMSSFSSRSSQPTEASGTNEPDFRYFSGVWCKKSGRKHKKWEGDAHMKVGVRSIHLLDEDGNDLGKSSGHKLSELVALEVGSLVSVGSREVEITDVRTQEDWEMMLANCRKKETENKPMPVKKAKRKREDMCDDEPEGEPSHKSQILDRLLSTSKTMFKPFKVPLKAGSETIVRARTVAPGVPMFDPTRADSLVFPRPPPGHPLHTDRLVDVVLDPHLAKKLRPHQRTGVLFLYTAVMGIKDIKTKDGPYSTGGAILADDMGLGKTLQTVSLIWTLMKQSPVAGSVIAKKVLIIAPSSLLNNWENEFRKWLGSERMRVHVADSMNKVATFRSYTTAPILILSYEMLVRAEEELLQIKWNLIVCDEAHRLKNSEIKTSCCLNRLQCPRKILLTGTPVQNDLTEYYCLINTIAPGLLGSKTEFNAEYVARIELSRQPDCGSDALSAGEEAFRQLAEISNHILLRRTSEIISKYLPPRTLNVVFCRPTQFQEAVYAEESARLLDIFDNDPGCHLQGISNLRKICNSSFLHNAADGRPDLPVSWEEQSGKLCVVTCMLLALVQETDEKIVLVSLSTVVLDLMATLCNRHSIEHLRLDGSTQSSSRQQIVNSFNSTSSARVFLLSSKAGGTGLNLTGGSRIILYDIDWNPATDLQAMSRIWREGQKRQCHIYRLLTTGSIEEKIYQRQLMKSGLAASIETAGLGSSGSANAAHFTREELKDLFTLKAGTDCDTHDLLECNCGGSGCSSQVEFDENQGDSSDSRSCQLGAKTTTNRSKSSMEQLKAWRHYAPPISDWIEDTVLASAGDYVSFLMRFVEDTVQA